MALLGTFAGLAIVLTVVGLYGVMMYSVAGRTREIGVRMALGARRGIVLKMVLRDAAILLAIGIAVGRDGSDDFSLAAAKHVVRNWIAQPAGVDAGMHRSRIGGLDRRLYPCLPRRLD